MFETDPQSLSEHVYCTGAGWLLHAPLLHPYVQEIDFAEDVLFRQENSFRVFELLQ
jgi:hypothetical protein